MLLELTVAEQRFNAVMEVLRDGLTVIEVADRYGSAAKPSTPGFAATPQVAWTPWPTAPIALIAARTRCPPRSRRGSVNCAATIQAGVSAAWPMNWSALAWIHRPG